MTDTPFPGCTYCGHTLFDFTPHSVVAVNAFCRGCGAGFLIFYQRGQAFLDREIRPPERTDTVSHRNAREGSQPGAATAAPRKENLPCGARRTQTAGKKKRAPKRVAGEQTAGGEELGYPPFASSLS